MSTTKTTLIGAPGPVTDRRLVRALDGIGTALRSGLGIVAFLGDPNIARTLPDRLVRPLSEVILKGGTFVEGARRSKLFLKHELALLETGEQTGRLDDAVLDVARGIKQRMDERAILVGGAIYPALLLVAANTILPLPMIVTNGVKAYVLSAFWMPAIIATLGFLLLWHLPRLPVTDPRRSLPFRIGQNLPIARIAISKRSEATFAFVLGRAISAGLPIDRALELSGDAAGMEKYRRAANVVRNQVRSGATLADGMNAGGVFNDIFIGQIAQGERTGTLDRVLDAYASEAFEASSTLMKRFSRTLMGVIMVVVMAFIGFGIVTGFMGVMSQVEEATNPMNYQ
ncbi:MAG: type II secretory pathway component PulF [Bradymonadia bacterium]